MQLRVRGQPAAQQQHGPASPERSAFDAAIGRNITDRVTAYLEMSVPMISNYPVYKFKTELRISVKF